MNWNAIVNIQNAALTSDPTIILVATARAAEKAAEAGARQSGGNVPAALGVASDEALSAAYAAPPKTVAGIAALASLVLDVEDCDPEIVAALRSIESAARTLSRF